jgi:hypothetical protein
MKQRSSVGRKGPLLALEKASKQELAGALQRRQARRLRLNIEQIRESFESSRKTDVDLAKKIAAFRFKHSKEINAAVLADPRFLPRFIEEYQSAASGKPMRGGPGRPITGGFTRSSEYLLRFDVIGKALADYYCQTVSNPLVDSMPFILSCPSTLRVGDASLVTVTGESLEQ